MLTNNKSGLSGKANLLFILPVLIILFTISGMINGSKLFANGKGNKDDKVYSKCDQMPTYPGGDKAMSEFIIENIRYPETSKKDGVQGISYVEFIVDKDGSVTEVQVKKGINTECDNEAVRVVKSMTKWNPGKDKGKEVKVKIVMPIKFALK